MASAGSRWREAAKVMDQVGARLSHGFSGRARRPLLCALEVAAPTEYRCGHGPLVAAALVRPSKR
jgi:hypothetical protein